MQQMQQLPGCHNDFWILALKVVGPEGPPGSSTVSECLPGPSEVNSTGSTHRVWSRSPVFLYVSVLGRNTEKSEKKTSKTWRILKN